MFNFNETPQEPFGWMAAKDWTSTVDVLMKTGQVEKAPELNGLYTNEFLRCGPIGAPAAMRSRLELWRRQQAALERGEDPTRVEAPGESTCSRSSAAQ